ncbi:MAG: B12-binding domain-containing radical SAM protein [Deltaproteobacteria bacterium]|nr:B12-binding domain-containing radical SAM protein [Deltaproteobacteria bacterium]
MRVVLVYPDMADLYPIFKTRTVRKIEPQVPLGLAYLGTALIRAGHETYIIDNHLEAMSADELATKVLGCRPDVLGISMTCSNIQQSLGLARSVKASYGKIPIVVGGPHPTLVPEKVQFPEFDYLVMGEGELSLPVLLEHIDENKVPIPNGVFYKDAGGNWTYSGPSEPLLDLDALGVPARGLLNLDGYPKGRKLLDCEPVHSISSSRGCPYRCSFCSSSLYWKRKHRCRSPVKVVEEIEMLVSEYGAAGIDFREDNFLVNKRNVLGICDEIIKRGLQIEWACEARVDNLDGEVLDAMVRAGCRGVWCGVESGSQKILDFIKKGYSVEQVKKAFEMLHARGIRTCAGFMIGFPGETLDDIRQTFDLARRIRPSTMYFQSYVAYPGSELYNYVVNRGMVDKEWFGTYSVIPDKIPLGWVPVLEEWLGFYAMRKRAPRITPFTIRKFHLRQKLSAALDRFPNIKMILKKLRDRFFPVKRLAGEVPASGFYDVTERACGKQNE